MNIKRIFHDPIHKEIVFDSGKPEESMILELIDTAAFQRLRRIKQLGAASLLFHGAESSRFTHSIGVFYIARKIYQRLIENKSSFCENIFVLYGAALLHDLGHGPLSHTSEAIFDHNHEQWSQNLVQNYSPINSILKKYDDELPRKIAELFQSNQIFSNPLKTLISSEIDCDRLDYLLRDSYNTGTKYGLVDLERIISALTFSPDGNIAIKPKGVIAIEHFLVLRNLMYRTIYNHKINEISTWILEKIIFTLKNNFEKIDTEIIYSTIVELKEGNIQKNEMEQIILIKVPTEIYSELRQIFVFLFENSGFKDVKISETVDFEKLYKMRKVQ